MTSHTSPDISAGECTAGQSAGEHRAGCALVTGAGQRLGAAMACELARNGMDVAVHFASSGAQAKDVAGLVRAMGRQATTLRADFLDEAQVDALIPAAAAALGGPITCLVNNASIFEDDRITNMTRKSWDRHIESNLRAPVVLTQAMASRCPEPKTDVAGEAVAQGLVVNMIDQRVRNLDPAFMSYTIAKMGLWAFTRTAAQALAPRVRVNAIGPGPTLRGWRQSQESFARHRASTPLKRGADTGDISASLAYLLTAQSVTGQLICVDGGEHLSWTGAASGKH